MARIFFSYSHADEVLRDRLEVHLANLKRSGRIEAWHDRRIPPGDAFAAAIDGNLDAADIILLLVSADFIASRYCYDIEMRRAMERHATGEARVVPVILNYCDWKDTPFAGMQALPKDARPIASWPNLEEAFLDVVAGIRAVLPATAAAAPVAMPAATASTAVPLPRSGNLRVRRGFTDADRAQFLHDAFDYLKRFFRGSLDELASRHAHIETRFRDIDANTFTAVVYEHGRQVAQCQVRLGGIGGDGITFSHSIEAGNSSFNEQLQVEDDEISLFLKPLGMMFHQRPETRDAKLTLEGAAEFFWSALISSLQ